MKAVKAFGVAFGENNEGARFAPLPAKRCAFDARIEVSGVALAGSNVSVYTH